MSQASPSALVIRLDALGDAVALTPLLLALRERAIPTDLVGSAANAALFTAAAVRETFVPPFSLRDGSPANLAAIDAFGAQLRKRNYTSVLVATEDPAGYRLARMTEAPVRIGFENGWAKPLKSLWIRSTLTRSVHRSAGLDPRAPHECETLFRLGAPLLDETARPTRDPQRLTPLLLDERPPTERRIVFQVTDKWVRLGIDDDAVVNLARSLAARYDLRCVATCAEAAFAQRFERSTGLAVECFGELAPWKSALAAGKALVAPDCGAIHVAGMLGTPTVAIFPPQPNFALHVARWAPWAARAEIVRAGAGWPSDALKRLARLIDTSPSGDRARNRPRAGDPVR
ncbi:MAG: glycosyltransferase family 9 protein [Vulcanimicrobiaceae bacterium]